MYTAFTILREWDKAHYYGSEKKIVRGPIDLLVTYIQLT